VRSCCDFGREVNANRANSKIYFAIHPVLLTF